MNKSEIYARVEDGEVTEYPVKLEQILNRNHPMHWYLPTKELQVENTNLPFTALSMQFEVKKGYVEISYKRVQKPFSMILKSFGQEGRVKYITSLTPSEVETLKKLTIEYIEDYIETLAKSLGYDSLDNLLGRYRNSTVVKYRREAEEVQKVLDESWKRLEYYFINLQEEQEALPSSIDELNHRIGLPSIETFMKTPEEPVEVPVPTEDGVISF